MRLIDADELLTAFPVDDEPTLTKSCVRMTIQHMPTIEPEQRWIPVTERMPKVGKTVICQCRADILKLLKLDSGGDWYQDAEHAYMSGFVLAWMPLPKVYKGGRRG